MFSVVFASCWSSEEQVSNTYSVQMWLDKMYTTITVKDVEVKEL